MSQRNNIPRDDPTGRRQFGLHRFMGVKMELASDVLVPRQETELLGRAAVAILLERAERQLVIDMCCGSGNLAVAIATECPAVDVWAADLTDATVALARRNAARLGLGQRVTIRQGDLFAAFADTDLEGRVDMVVCNPPYISTSRLDDESAHMLESEPRQAFDGGPYGISILQRLVRDAASFIRPGGWLLFEFGEGQDRQSAALISRTGAYEEPILARAHGGAARVAKARKRGNGDCGDRA